MHVVKLTLITSAVIEYQCNEDSESLNPKILAHGLGYNIELLVFGLGRELIIQVTGPSRQANPEAHQPNFP